MLMIPLGWRERVASLSSELCKQRWQGEFLPLGGVLRLHGPYFSKVVSRHPALGARNNCLGGVVEPSGK
jgi:hypothetical protein